MLHPTSRPGFTLIELIIVIAIIAIIAASAFVAIDPVRRFQSSRNGSRWTDVTAILQALKTYQVDTKGSLPASLDAVAASVQIIGEAVGACTSLTCTGQTVAATACGIDDLDTTLASYLKTVPKDPKSGTNANTRYYANVDANGFMSVGACDEEGEGPNGVAPAPVIEVSR